MGHRWYPIFRGEPTHTSPGKNDFSHVPAMPFARLGLVQFVYIYT